MGHSLPFYHLSTGRHLLTIPVFLSLPTIFSRSQIRFVNCPALATERHTHALFLHPLKIRKEHDITML
jgi:hypothetical protein